VCAKRAKECDCEAITQLKGVLEMNLPNKLTILRVIMIPFFVFFLLTTVAGDASKWIALVIFIVASMTDWLDGYLARKNNLVTNFGKFMDPLADKLLVCSAMICLVQMDKLAGWMVIIIISREFIISGFRLIASDNGVVIAASYWGKFKTVFQMVMIILLIADFQNAVVQGITIGCVWIALILTIVSLIDYLIKNKGVLSNGK
jgi:CDP-diacylglycerol---glycerol-3-phosphate 3-phosphatidyltransferase